MSIEITRAEQLPGRGSGFDAVQTVSYWKRWVGKLPEAWVLKEIRALGKVITGTTPPTSEATHYGGEYPFVGPGDLGDFKPVERSERSLSKTGVKHVRLVPAGSTLFTCISFAIGKTGQAARQLATNQQINAVVPAPGTDADYLYYLLTFFSNRIKSLAGVQATPILSKSAFEKIELAVPPLPEQRKIARVLGARDRALADLDALIAAKHRRKQGLAERLLTGRARLTEFESQVVPARPLGTFFRHFSTRNRENRDLTALSCSKVHGIVPQTEIFDKRIASEDTRTYKVVRRGDLVYDPMLLWDASIGFVDSVDAGVISPAYATFHLNEQTADRSFFRHLFGSHYMRHQYKVISQGTNARRRKAMASDFLAVEVRVPELDEQHKIAAILDAAGAEIVALRDQRDALARQKKGLMQRLLTGEVRVTPDPEDCREA